jgi:hypothetical protein
MSSHKDVLRSCLRRKKNNWRLAGCFYRPPDAGALYAIGSCIDATHLRGAAEWHNSFSSEPN